MALFHVRDVLIPLLAILMAGILLLWLERRPRRNLFLVRRDDPSVYEIETDFGRFIIDRKNRCLRVRSSSRIDEIPLELFERFDISFRTEDPAHGLSRDLARGTVAWRYASQAVWYRISLIERGETEPLPIFEVGQYLPTNFFTSRFFQVESAILKRLAEFHDPADRARFVLGQVQAAFAASGHPIGLNPARIPAKQPPA